MPWQNDGGSGGGPWGSGGGDGPRNPWGNGPAGKGGKGSGGGGNRGGNVDFDEFIRRSQEKLRGSLPGGRGGRTPWAYIAGGIVLLWIALTSVYVVAPQERGVVTRFGKYVETTRAGVHFKLPAPIDAVQKPKVEQVSTTDIGSSDGSSENLMLTGDQNIIDIAYGVRWKIKDPENFLFQLEDAEGTIREVAESAMRAEIGRATLNAAIGPQRAAIGDQVRARVQEMLDSYRAGVEVLGVDIRQADPPQAVDAAFKDVSAAQQEAQQYLNNARAYAQELTARAQGEAALFDAVYAQYALAPEVTRKRIYLETMEQVLGRVDKTILPADNNVTPYLPLPELQRRARPAPEAAPAPAQ